MEREKQKELRERILFEAENLMLSCEKAFAIASEVDCSHAEVGRVCNEIDIKIAHCQLGCF